MTRIIEAVFFLIMVTAGFFSCTDSVIITRLKELQREIYFVPVEDIKAVPRDGGILFTWDEKNYPVEYRIVFAFRQDSDYLFTVKADPRQGELFYATTRYIGYYIDAYLEDENKEKTALQFLGEVCAASSGDLYVSNAGEGSVNGVYKRNSVINQVTIGDALYFVHYSAAGRVWNPYQCIAYVVDFDNGIDNWTIYYEDNGFSFYYKNMTNLGQQEVLGACPFNGWELDVAGVAPSPIFSVIP